jgi:eukaryotic-like serine/threonine-protein kinase
MSRCPSAQDLERWLDEECDDARQDDVARHVGACSRCQATLEQLTEKTCVLSSLHPLRPPAQADRTALPAEDSTDFLARLKQTPPSLGPGRTSPFASARATSDSAELPVVAGYEILSELGRGGMGVVYKARHLALNRVVALKMILDGAHAGPKDLERFRQEAEAVARLHHPNIVQIFDIGESEGRPYFVLEYVEEGNLASCLRGDPQPLKPTVRLIETLARAIHFAHQYRVVHRDLKPANILLQKRAITQHTQEGIGGTSPPLFSPPPSSEEGDPGNSWFKSLPKITDFGLAKRLDEKASWSRSGEVLGTPSYMAPEQADIKVREIGPTTDVYALGAILYEMLTGRPPFKGATALDTVLQVLHEEPVRPSGLRPKLPRDLETICLECLRKEPGRRYASAAALADDLRRFLKDEPIKARPVGPLERGWKWAHRRPLSAALAAGIIVVAVLGFAGVTWQWQEARLARDTAVQERNEKEVQRLQARNALYSSRIAQSQLQWRVNDTPGALNSLADCVRKDDLLDRRGWEWYYLHTLYHPELFTFSHQHRGPEGAVAFRPDGGAIACVVSYPHAWEGRRSEFRLWDAASGEAIHQRALDGSFHRLAFSPDGRLLVLGGTDGMVQVWDAVTCQVLRAFQPHATRISGLAFSADGMTVASAALAPPTLDGSIRPGEAKLWDAQRGTVLHTLTTPDGTGVHSVAFHPRLPFLASGGEDGVVRIWETTTGKEVRPLAGHKSAIHSIAFNPDGTLLVSAGSNGNLKLWDFEANLKDPKAPQSLTGRTGAILNLAFSPDGRYLAYSGTDKTVRIWDVESGIGFITFRGHTGAVESVQFSPDGQRLVSCSPAQGEVKVWDLTRHPEFATLAQTRTDVESIAFHEDGRHLVSMTIDGKLQVWDAASGMLDAERDLATSAELVEPAGVLAAFAPGGQRLAARCRGDGSLVGIWDVDGGERVAVCRDHTLAVHCLRFSPDGRRLASCACDKSRAGKPHEIKVWDAADGTLLMSLSGRGRLFALAFSPDGRWLAVGGEDGIKVLDGSSGRELVHLAGDKSEVTALAFSPDGWRLASAGIQENKVHLWSCVDWGAASGHEEPLITMTAPGLLCDLAFSPDGKRLAGASRDLIKMWDAETGVEVLTLLGAPQRYRDPPFNARVVFHPDGTRLAGTNWNESISVWTAPLRTDEEARLRQQEARRQAAAERAKFWHLQVAEHFVEHKNWTAAKFHLDRLGDAALPPPLRERKEHVLAEVAKARK